MGSHDREKLVRGTKHMNGGNRSGFYEATVQSVAFWTLSDVVEHLVDDELIRRKVLFCCRPEKVCMLCPPSVSVLVSRMKNS